MKHFEAKIVIDMNHVVTKPAFYICENKDADQLRGNREADQRLYFRYIDNTILLLPIYEISSSLFFVGPGRKPRRPVFSQRVSYVSTRNTHIWTKILSCFVSDSCSSCSC